LKFLHKSYNLHLYLPGIMSTNWNFAFAPEAAAWNQTNWQLKQPQLM